MDRLAAWQTFVAVATAKSFVAVARAQRRSPQAITRAIAALEAHVGARLLHRTTRSVSLTGDGERCLEQARRALAEIDTLELAARPAAPAGRLAITAPVLFGQMRVAPLVLEFLAEHPRVDAHLTLVDRVVALADEGIDLAVRIGELPDSALRARQVGHVRTVACASPSYLARAGVPTTPAALARHACIALGGTAATDRWTFAGRRSVAIHARLVTNTGQSAIDAALAGVGIARLLSYQVADLVERDALRIVLRRFEPPPSPVHLVWLPGPRSRAATAFAELAATRLAANL